MSVQSNEFWNIISDFLSTPTAEQIACQAPKPILLNTGEVKLPYDWDPASVPISLFKVGRLFILSVPSEFTTMAGRRLRRAVRDILVKEGGIDDPIITIAGLANSYTHYVTTVEEYAGQRYEAASTLYGPHTLAAYIQEFQRITRDLLEGKASTTDEAPKDLSKKQISLLPPVELDTIGIGKKVRALETACVMEHFYLNLLISVISFDIMPFSKQFGSVTIDASEQYAVGETVFVSFHSANPRNNQRIEDTFLTVDMLENDGSWKTKYVDGDWCTQFFWKSGFLYFGVSFGEITWDIPPETPQGLYRICHFGTRRTLLGDTTAAFLDAPDWLTSSALGSMAFNMVVDIFKLAMKYSESVRSRWDLLSEPRYKDFSGCSRTFLVKENNLP